MKETKEVKEITKLLMPPWLTGGVLTQNTNHIVRSHRVLTASRRETSKVTIDSLVKLPNYIASCF